jgi:hypothetical protein
MARMPRNTRSLTGFGEYGVDDKGEKVFFTLVTSKWRATFLANHKGLADTIHYLQQIAQRAEERRIATLPKEDHVQVLPTHSKVVRKGSLMPDVTGQLARLEATTPSGLPVEFQLEFGALVSLQERLPDLIQKMRQLQDQHKQQADKTPRRRRLG